MEDQYTSPKLHLTVVTDQLLLFTTLLQSGIEIQTSAGTDIGSFLGDLQGFTPEYLASSVETIFLNGTPVDNLQQPISGEEPVLAISAAMPGLAGAIFRKNSIHSALRSDTESLESFRNSTTLSVTLKLFNSIAKERGEELLHSGIHIKTTKFMTFLEKRPSLKNYITGCMVDDRAVMITELFAALSGSPRLFLQITTDNA
jgi:hypothetical protein